MIANIILSMMIALAASCMMGCDDAEDFLRSATLQDDDDDGSSRIVEAINTQGGLTRSEIAQEGDQTQELLIGLTSTQPADIDHASPTESNVVGSGGFVWKPISEGDGNLVILLPSYSSATSLSVNGEQARYVGRTNGDRSTHRLGSPGCAYGAFPTIETDTADETPPIANGCNRVDG